ncbi:hypothetical protein B4113_3032 [Geobacillus sp. B4113_201601]|nr:hypothetical protein B4113_3032 [Geobacillus sp. B4113_201601]
MVDDVLLAFACLHKKIPRLRSGGAAHPVSKNGHTLPISC